MSPFPPCFWQRSALVAERGLCSSGTARWPEYAGLLWSFLAELRLPGVLGQGGIDGWMGVWVDGWMDGCAACPWWSTGCSWKAELLWQLCPQPKSPP